MNSKNWYLAIIVLSSSLPSDEEAILLLYKLIHAKDHERAFALAEDIGIQEERSWSSGDSDWKYKGLANLAQIEDKKLSHGTEVLMRLEEGESSNYIRAKDKLRVFCKD